MAVTDINSLTYGGDTFNLKDPTKYQKPATGIPQTDLAQTVQNKLNKTVVISDTQPTETENKLWVDTDAGAGANYQIPTVAEMQAADNSILGNLAMIESSPATQAHAVGEYIVYNGQLYNVTAAIAQGESLVSGTNIRSSKIADQIRTYATGLKVVNPNGNNFIYFLGKNDVLNALGRTEVDMDKVYVTAQNAAWSTEFGFIQVTGVSRQSNTFIAHLSDGRTGNMKITYAIFYSD